MDARQERGLVLAAKARIIKKGLTWLVPSQTGNGQKYYVNQKAGTCTCPDHQECGHKCKHLFAVEYVIEREYSEDGTLTEVETLTFQSRKTYPQNWANYNRAQTTEKETFQVLLHDLCSGVRDEKRNGRGRPRIPVQDAIFSATLKIYSGMSGRRFMTDMREAHANGFTSRAVHYNSIFDILEAPETGSILQSLIVASAGPLKAVETKFAVDSTGFSGCKFEKWFDEKFGDQRSKRSWVKCHAMVGTTTGIITAVEVLGKESSDMANFKPLVGVTANQFSISEVSADMAYLSESNLQAVESIGGTALIPFKKNSQPTRPGLWNKAYHYFHLNREEFLSRYHNRSNIESVFSSIKRLFGDSVRGKTPTSMRNEALGKCLAHNICVLIHAMHELGIDPNFRAEQTVARQFNVI